MRGKQPYWMSRIMQHHIKPVAAKSGIEIKGWRTLRHSYTTLLRQNNDNPNRGKNTRKLKYQMKVGNSPPRRVHRPG